MPLSTKQFAIIGSGVATIGGGSLGTYYLLKEKTIADRITKSGETLAKENKDYEDIFKALKDEEELTKLISTTEKEITRDSKDDEAGTALKIWCNKNLKKDLSDKASEPLIEKARKYCTKAPLTIGQKINKSSKKLITGASWGTRFSGIKATDGALLKDLGAINEEIKDFEGEAKISKAVNALEKWCTDIQKTELTKDEDNAIWLTVDARCLEKRN